MKKKIVIIGATSGIGKEMALQYLQKGHLVGITGRRKWLLEDLKIQFPNQVVYECFDVKDPDTHKHLNNLINALHGLDLLIYNAGVGHPSKELNIANETETTLINVNGFVAAANFAFTYFRKQGYGHLVSISSIAGLVGNSWTPAYSASKAFISNYAESLRMKAYTLGINIVVTDIRPGFMNTKDAENYDRFWAASPSKAAKQIIKAIEVKKKIAYITKRWWLVAILLKVLPYQVYKRFL